MVSQCLLKLDNMLHSQEEEEIFFSILCLDAQNIKSIGTGGGGTPQDIGYHARRLGPTFAKFFE